MIRKPSPKYLALRDSFLRHFFHLRLHFQLLFSPIFLWGYLLGEGRLNPRFWIAFVAFHIFLYGGTTTYNSYYDRDEGPVGGLEKPPPLRQNYCHFRWSYRPLGHSWLRSLTQHSSVSTS